MGDETFELERFAWASPDRLKIDGRFVGLVGDEPRGDPVLVLYGAERIHRLPGTTDAGGEDGELHAEFTWQEAPTAFGTVDLEVGDDLVVRLPEPRSETGKSALDVLAVRRRGGTERPRLQTELFTVRSELAEARAGRPRLGKE